MQSDRGGERRRQRAMCDTQRVPALQQRLQLLHLVEAARRHRRHLRADATLLPDHHQLVQPRARLMHAEQRPCSMAQKIAGGGCAVATNLEHTCSLELYTQVATTIGARSNFTLR